MALFAAGGTRVYGMAEESPPFYTLLVPVMMAACFDPLVVAATVAVWRSIGVLGSTINPFATVIAANASGIPFTIISRRVGMLIAGCSICVAQRCVTQEWFADPTTSIVYDKYEENKAHF